MSRKSKRRRHTNKSKAAQISLNQRQAREENSPECKDVTNLALGRKIHHFVDKGCEWWIDYDQRGNIVHKKTIYSSGNEVEFWIEYNDQNNETHFQTNDGFEYWCIYNSKGNISKYWDTTGYQEVYSYYNGVVYCKTSNNDKIKRIWNSKDKELLTIHNF